MENIEKNAFSFLEFPSKIGHFSWELSTAHSENSEIGRLNCFFDFFAFKIQFPHILTTYNVGTTLCNSLWSLSKMRVSSTQIMTSSRSSSYVVLAGSQTTSTARAPWFTSIYFDLPWITSIYPNSPPQHTLIYLKLLEFSLNTSIYLNSPQFILICLNLPQFTLDYLNLSWFSSIDLDLPQFTFVNLNLPWFTSIYLDLPQFPWFTSIDLDLPQFTLTYLNLS